MGFGRVLADITRLAVIVKVLVPPRRTGTFFILVSRGSIAHQTSSRSTNSSVTLALGIVLSVVVGACWFISFDLGLGA